MGKIAPIMGIGFDLANKSALNRFIFTYQRQFVRSILFDLKKKLMFNEYADLDLAADPVLTDPDFEEYMDLVQTVFANRDPARFQQIEFQAKSAAGTEYPSAAAEFLHESDWVRLLWLKDSLGVTKDNKPEAIALRQRDWMKRSYSREQRDTQTRSGRL